MTANPLCYVKKPGIFTTIQDKGRFGFQSQGITPSGVMDEFAYTVANILVGNDPKESVLEITLTGPVLKFESPAKIVITGADLQPQINGQSAPIWMSFSVKPGDQLSFKGPRKGARAYVAVRGGFDGEETLQSKATFIKAKIGGMEGRSLKKGDMLYFSSSFDHIDTAGKGLHPAYIPEYPDESLLRVLQGPEAHLFTKEAVETFYQANYTVTNQSDRMGIRLKGDTLIHRRNADILSDAVPMGTVQVAADGKPMILMADRQTTGGYTRIANVITADLPKAAQMLPGQMVTFRKVSLEEAHHSLRKQQILFARLRFARENS